MVFIKRKTGTRANEVFANFRMYFLKFTHVQDVRYMQGEPTADTPVYATSADGRPEVRNGRVCAKVTIREIRGFPRIAHPMLP